MQIINKKILLSILALALVFPTMSDLKSGSWFSQKTQPTIKTNAKATANSSNQSNDPSGVQSGEATASVSVSTVVNTDIEQETIVVVEAEPEESAVVVVEQEIPQPEEETRPSLWDRIFKFFR